MSVINEHPWDWPVWVTAQSLQSFQTHGKSRMWPNCRWPSQSHGLWQGGDSYPCKHCCVQWCQEQLGAQLVLHSLIFHPDWNSQSCCRWPQAHLGSPRLIQIHLVVYKQPIKHLVTQGPVSSRWCPGVPQLGFVSRLAVSLKKKLILRNASKGQFRNAHQSH